MSSEWPPTPDAWPTDPDPAPGLPPMMYGPHAQTPSHQAPVPPESSLGTQGSFESAPALPGPDFTSVYPPAEYPAAPAPLPAYVPGHYGEDGQWVPPQYPQAQLELEQPLWGTAGHEWPSAAPVPAPIAAPRPSSPLRNGLMAGLAVVPLVIGLLWVNTTFLQPAQSAGTLPRTTASATASSSTSAKPTGSASPSPSASPTATMPTDPKVIVKSNPIYGVAVSAKCPDQARPSSTDEFRAQVKGLVNCENTAWKTALAGTPVAFSKPKVKFYNTHVTSPCGKLGVTFPAAYCSMDKTLYFSIASYMQGRYYRLAVAQFVMHEYGHHVQQLAGILANRDALDESAVVTRRRVELQAHCLAHYGLNHAGLGFDSIDRDDAEYQFSYASDPIGHGSAGASRYWGRRGLAAGTVGACNTWSVKAGKVK